MPSITRYRCMNCSRQFPVPLINNEDELRKAQQAGQKFVSLRHAIIHCPECNSTNTLRD